MRRYKRLSFLLILSMIIAASLVTAAFPQGIDMRWEFVMPRSTMGWTASDITDFVSQSGGLKGTASGSDPKVISPEFKLAPSNEQIVEIAITSDKEGTAQFYWANTTEEPYGGFRDEKVLDFKVPGDKHQHVYRLTPFWKKEGQIIKIRIDPPAGSKFLINYVRIFKLPYMPAEKDPVWNFGVYQYVWIPVSGIEEKGVRESSNIYAVEPNSLFLSPAIDVSSKQAGWVMVRMLASAGSNASLIWATDQETGAHTVTFPLITDGRMHTYNIDMKQNPKWKGSILRLGLVPSDQQAEILINKIIAGNRRMGPAEVAVKQLTVADTAVQAGKQTKLVAVVQNIGGETAKDLTVKLILPAGVELKAGEAEQKIAELASDKESRLEWQISPTAAGEVKINLEVTGTEIPPASKELKFTTSEEVKKSESKS